jgi:hypothetical protein
VTLEQAHHSAAAAAAAVESDQQQAMEIAFRLGDIAEDPCHCHCIE